MPAIAQRFGIVASCIASMILVVTATTSATPHAKDGYIENQGQIGDQYGRPNGHVRFLVARPGLNVQLRGNGFSYDSYTIDRCTLAEDTIQRQRPEHLRDRPNEEVSYHFHRVDVDLVNANPRPVITATGPSADYLNYYTHITAQTQGDKGATFVRGYARVTYHDVWPNIDMEWLLDEQERPEYQFVVRPGGNVAHIRLRYRGADATRLADGALELDVLHGTMRERLPRSYLQASGREVAATYTYRTDDTYGFVLPLSDLARIDETLIIDPVPELMWGTYFGGSGGEQGRALAVTPGGGIVLAGMTTTPNAIATTGVHQVTLSGATDAFAAAFSSTGIRYWSTYYGGSGVERCSAVAATSIGSIILAGETTSLNAIATADAHQESFGGGSYDAFVTAFSNMGIRLWGSYYGGRSSDEGRALALTSDGDIVLAGETRSSNAIATTVGHQVTPGGKDDAFVAVFSSTGTRLWCTYYGGSDIDTPYALAVSSNGAIVLAGETRSTNAIASAGAHQESNSGYEDAFLVAFSTAGTRLWGTYYGGTDGDAGFAVAVTAGGDIVLAGRTRSPNGVATIGAHQEYQGGTPPDAFVAVFSNSGTRLWGTYYGGTEGASGAALAITPDGDIVLVGWTQSKNAIATMGSHQETYGGGIYDAFMTAFSYTGTRLWGTYYGGEGFDHGLALTVTPGGDIVLAGATTSTSAIATAGAHQETLAAQGGDAFVAVFREDPTLSNIVDISGQQTHTIARVSPNPASGQVVVTTSDTSASVLELVDALGRVCASVAVSAGTTETNLAIGGLSPGRYQLRLLPIALDHDTPARMQALIIVP